MAEAHLDLFYMGQRHKNRKMLTTYVEFQITIEVLGPKMSLV